MIKFFMPSPNEDWIGDVQTFEFKNFTNFTVVNDINNADVVWLYSKWIYDQFSINELLSKPVVTTVHHIVPWKNTDFSKFNMFTDIYHVPNAHTANELSKYTNKEIRVIPYWANISRWNYDIELNERKVESGLLVASFQRDTEGNSINLHNPLPKLEKGPDIFAGIVLNLNKYMSVIPYFPGWRRQYLHSILKGYVYTDKLKNDDIPLLYKRVSQNNGYYLVTSRVEGGPMSIIEAALMKVKILSTDVGLASDILHESCIVCKPDDKLIIEKFTNAIINDVVTDDIIEKNYKNVLKFNMHNIIPLYENLLKDACNI